MMVTFWGVLVAVRGGCAGLAGAVAPVCGQP